MRPCLVLILVFASMPFAFLGYGKTPVSTSVQNDDLKKIFRQNELEQEGKELVEQGLYDEAIERFKKADDPSIRVDGYRRSLPKGLLAKVYKLEGKYEEAWAEFNFLLSISPNQPSWLDEKLELEALIKARDTNSTEPIYEHIRYLKGKYEDMLPPKRYQATGLSPIVATDIIRLYDHIGDYDSGISFVDSLVHYFYSKNMFLKRVTTSREALKKAEERGKRWRTYKAVYEYLRVREAFEADKNEGRESCVGKTGVCVGRATQALIQSDYFPW